MLFNDIVATSHQVAETRKRRVKIELLANLLERLEGEEIEIAIAFLSGVLRQGSIGIGPAVLREAMSQQSGLPPPVETSGLQLREVDETFGGILGVSGKGSARRKLERVRGLLERATQPERRFLVRLVIGALRQGALEGVLVEAVARAAGLASASVRRAVMVTGDLAPVARVALTRGAASLASFAIELFRPLKPMLAQPADDVGCALEQIGEAALEYKLDGARIQVHKAGDEVRVFSRRLNEVTAAVPEVVEVTRGLPVRDLIADGEVIALSSDGRPHPFQVTMRRFGRKLDVDRLRETLPLSPFLFDLLHLDGGDLIDQPQARRFAELVGLAPAELIVPHTVTADEEDASAFLAGAMRSGHEGIMAKSTGAGYAAGGRGRSWLKVKPVHTLDLVVLAAEWGHGRRRGWLSNLHLGARDAEHGGFVMLGKTFKGLTDKLLAWQTEELQKIAIGRDRQTVFVEPRLVVEVAFNDLQASPRYPGGLALRFARVKRYRGDKTAREADTIEAVREIFMRSTGGELPDGRPPADSSLQMT